MRAGAGKHLGKFSRGALIRDLKAWPNRTTLFANMSIIMLVKCSWIFHVVDRSGQIGQHCSPTNSIRHKLSAVYVVLAAV